MRNLRTALLALILMTPVLADEAPAPGTVAATTIAGSALLGFQLAIQDSAAGKPAEEKLLACVSALEGKLLAGTLRALLAADMTPAELVEMDTFFSSAAGKKYERIGQLGIYTARNKPLPEPKPEFTSAEYAQLEAFSTTSAGNKYIYGRWVEKPQVRAGLQDALKGLFQGCQKRP